MTSIVRQTAPLRITLRTLGSWVLIAAVSAAGTRLRAQGTEFVQGKVTGPSAVAINGAIVTATSGDRTTQSTQTDAQGNFRVVLPAGPAPFVVRVVAVGFSPQSKPVGDRSAAGTRPDLNFEMAPTVQRLAAATTRAVRQRTQRNDGAGSTVGEPGRDNLTGSIGGDLTGDLAAALGTVPGILVTPDPNGGLPVITAFGLSAGDNSLTLNGMNFGAGSVPRDGLQLRVSQSTYDPGRGGFSGVQTTLRLPSGSNFVNQNVHITGEAPALQGTSPAAARFGSQYSRGILSGNWSGPMMEDKYYFNTAYQVSRRASDLATFASADRASLQAIGVSADSITRLATILGGLGIPRTTSGVPLDRSTTNASLLTRIDLAPNVTSRQGNLFYIIAGGNYSDNAGTGSAATATPGHSGDTKSWSGQLQATSSKFIGAILNEANLALVTTSNERAPYLFMPDARVLVNSSFPDGTLGSTTLRAGGNANSESKSRSTSVQLRNETSWFTMDSKHNLKITFDGRVDADATTQAGNRLGTFSYNSLADLAAGKPASFSRTLGTREATGRQFIGAVGFGDSWRPIQPLRVQYGVRIEGNAFGDRPALNSAVASAFGRNTNNVPGSLTIAPMIGFTRSYQKWGGGSFTGGIRQYSGALSSQTVEGVLRQTGLADAVQQLTCVGAAVPTPNWNAYHGSASSIPSQCADGTAGTPFSQATPNVTLFAPDYAPTRRWGAAAGWTGRVTSKWIGSALANYSLNLDRAGTYDLNFNPVVKFALANEGNRPVFVSPSSIVPASGAVAFTDSRRVAQFAQVNELRSDLRSESTQLTLGIAPAQSQQPPGRVITTSFRAFYTLNLNRDQYRGFGGNTSGDPRVTQWGESGLPKHSFQILGSVTFPGLMRVDGFARISSGRQYTPMISGDVNGDGLSNDRAFVFNPATADATTSAAISALLLRTPREAADCLRSQMGQVASRNSCKSPWTQTLNFAITPDLARWNLADRGSVSLIVSNALGALDQLFHGSDKLKNWGAPPAPDATLLNVRGFDPNTNKFRYDVNPLFGSSSAAQTVGRLPFAIAIDVQLRLGPDRDAQMLAGFLKPTANDGGKPVSAEVIKQRLDKDAQNNFDDIVNRGKAVQLTPAQVTALGTMAKRFDAHRDSAYRELAKYLAELKGKYKTVEARRHFHDVFVGIARNYVIAGPSVRSLLSEDQFAALPVSMTAFFDMDDATFDRIMRSASFTTLMELITGEGPD